MIDLTAALRNGHDDLASEQARATAAALAQADREGLVDVAIATMDSPIGTLSLAATPAGLVRVGFPRELDDFAEELADHVSPRVVRLPARLDDVRRQLDEYFEGRRRRFELAVDLSLAHGFRRLVLERLFDSVGFGETLSYMQLAERSGSPKASRAVGSAMANNPVPIVVPCHRVLRSGGNLGGYGGGLEVKRFLLGLEGAGGDDQLSLLTSSP
ncbi:MAG TPA: methylated-DNA--[protein]-cysteine S-methyltransferase [Acidimicrobiales bacterium]|nr:methylated-DNA--[protein]-cysteine S-methyltransferase [Acidimicrobiales bacterium]